MIKLCNSLQLIICYNLVKYKCVKREEEEMKKLLSVLCISLLLLGAMPVIHVHDDKCGYDPKTQTGCTFEYGIAPCQDRGPGM